MLSTLYSLATLATILLTVYGIGRPILRWLDVGDEGIAAATVWSVGLGFIATGWVLSIAALLGLLSPVLIGAVTVAGTFWGLCEAACLYLAIRNPLRVEVAALDDLAGRMQPKPPGTWLQRAVAVGFASTLFLTLVAALAPPISPSALGHSLELPKMILLGCPVASGAATPQFGGLIYAWALVLDGPVAATLVAWFFGILLAAATALLARGLVGRAWGWCAGAFVLLSPGIIYQMSAPLDDLMMAAFATLALAAWWRGSVELLATRWFVLAGLFLGAALATKVVAVALLVAVAVAWSLKAAKREENRTEVAVGAAQTVLIAVAVACPWWAWVIVRGGALATIDTGPSSIVQCGPWFLALLPGWLLVRRLRGLTMLVGTALCFLLVSALVVPQSRIFAPMVPLLAVIGVWVCMELPRLPMAARRVAVGSLAIIATILIATNAVPAIDRWRVACGIESRTAYLRQRVGAFPASEIANRVVRSGSRLLSQDNCGLYFDCPVMTDVKAHQQDVTKNASNASEELLGGLHDAGFTHLLVCSPEGADDQRAAANTALRQAISEEVTKPESERVLPLTEYRFTDSSGRRMHYQLFMLRR